MDVPDDIAKVSVLLASSASYMTGETVTVEGGGCSGEASATRPGTAGPGL